MKVTIYLKEPPNMDISIELTIETVKRLQEQIGSGEGVICLRTETKAVDIPANNVAYMVEEQE